MEIVNFAPQQFVNVGASGLCPHCPNQSYFRPVGAAYIEQILGRQGNRIVNAAQCESCKGFILVVGERPFQQQPYTLVDVYPLGKPDDRVDDAVPDEIKPDFREALRCQWVKAYKATVAMCRRAIQASALEKGASPKKKLVEQIDELAGKGLITKPLQRLAHRIRLTGNVGAHPDEDGLADVTGQDADDIIDFTHQFFEHVYVMPAKLEAHEKREKEAAESSPNSGGVE